MTQSRSVNSSKPAARPLLWTAALTATLLLAAWAAGPSPSAPAPAPSDTPPPLTEAAARKVSANNLKQLALALIAYADANRGRLPTAAVYDAKGKALLSWRVTILPYL